MQPPGCGPVPVSLTVSDARGMRVYGDDSIMTRLSMNFTVLDAARENLVRIGLIAWRKPLYQVLSLDTVRFAARASMEKSLSFRDIFKKIIEGPCHD
ncbi:MAG: hypothetical protein WA151_05375 [Desulfatirhabdiaceae bacterium]